MTYNDKGGVATGGEPTLTLDDVLRAKIKPNGKTISIVSYPQYFDYEIVHSGTLGHLADKISLLIHIHCVFYWFRKGTYDQYDSRLPVYK